MKYGCDVCVRYMFIKYVLMCLMYFCDICMWHICVMNLIVMYVCYICVISLCDNVCDICVSDMCVICCCWWAYKLCCYLYFTGAASSIIRVVGCVVWRWAGSPINLVYFQGSLTTWPDWETLFLKPRNKQDFTSDGLTIVDNSIGWLSITE